MDIRVNMPEYGNPLLNDHRSALEHLEDPDEYYPNQGGQGGQGGQGEDGGMGRVNGINGMNGIDGIDGMDVDDYPLAGATALQAQAGAQAILDKVG